MSGYEETSLFRHEVFTRMHQALAGGAAISGLLAVVLTDIRQFDLPAFGIVTCFLAIVALSACYFPARRATQVDPMTALRHE